MNTEQTGMPWAPPMVDEESEFYPTSDQLARSVCRLLAGTYNTVPLLSAPPQVIIEPSAGEGGFVRAIRHAWPGVDLLAIEPDEGRRNTLWIGAMGAYGHISPCRWEDDGAAKAVNRLIHPNEHTGRTALIIGNPPFSFAMDHIELAMERLGHGTATEPRHRWLAFLLRSTFLGGVKRTARLRKLGGLRHVRRIVPRPSFDGEGNDMSDYDLCVWQSGWHGESTFGHLCWRESTRSAA